MRVIRAIDFLANTGFITDTDLGTDATAEYDDATAYSAGDQRKVTGTAGGAATATYKIYEALQATTGDDPTEDVGTVSPGVGTYWKEVGSVNEWAFANSVIQDQTSKSSSFYIKIDAGQRIPAIAFFNLEAAQINITVNSTANGEVHNQDYSLLQDRSGGSWYNWFFEPIVQMGNFVVMDIPAYTDATVTITISNGSSDAKVGAIIAGKAFTVGESQFDSAYDFINYTRAEYIPELGRTIITEKDFSEDGDIDVVILKARFQYVKQELYKLRGVVSAWIPDENDQGTPIMGYLKSMKTILNGPVAIQANLDIEGVA